VQHLPDGGVGAIAENVAENASSPMLGLSKIKWVDRQVRFQSRLHG
jgi:hypothetical protein